MEQVFDEVMEDELTTAEVQTVAMPVDVMNAVLEYLGGQPYSRVFGLVNAIQGAASKQQLN